MRAPHTGESYGLTRGRKVIFVEGMSGSGKSTLAQHIWMQLAAQDTRAEWFHEEETDHPSYRESLDEFLENNQPSVFRDRIIDNWTAFFDAGDDDFGICIFEAQILLSTIANLLWSGYSRDEFDPLRSCFLCALNARKDNNHIYLYTREPERILDNTFRHRGEAWKSWYVGLFDTSGYARKNHLSGRDGIARLWTDVHAIADSFFDQITCDKLKVDITKQEWQKYYADLSRHFQYGFAPLMKPKANLSEYVGRYFCGNEEIVVYQEDGVLLCDFGLPGLSLIPKPERDEFYIKAFPHALHFQRRGVTVIAVRIGGKDISGLRGREYTKTGQSTP